MTKADAIFTKGTGGIHIVTINFRKEHRSFRVYSQRAGLVLVQLAKAFPDGVTKKSMNRKHRNLTDNKMFDELRNQSGFSSFMFKDGRQEQVEVNKIDLNKLWKSTEGSQQPIWFGVEKQTGVQQFLEKLIERDGFKCNITKVPLLRTPEKNTFAKNMRRKSIDHRRPQLKKGKTNLDNLQLLSEYINERKKQICSICEEDQCEECALAFPENSSIILPTSENISYWLQKN